MLLVFMAFINDVSVVFVLFYHCSDVADIDMYRSVCSGPAVQGELCLGPGEECLRHRRGHLLVKVGGQEVLSVGNRYFCTCFFSEATEDYE